MKPEPAPEEVAYLERLFRESRFLDAHAELDRWAEPEDWTSSRARVAAGRLLGNLGAMGRARRLVLATWRRDRDHPGATYFAALDYERKHGPVEMLRLLETHLPDAPMGDVMNEDVVALWLLRGRCLAQCRDFDAAEGWVAAGERALPNEPWPQLERAAVLEAADRYPEALAAAERALARRPGYLRAVWEVAHLQVLNGQDEGALAFLRREVPAGQGAHVAFQLGELLVEREQWEEAAAAFALAGERWPRAEKALRDALGMRRAAVWHRLGRDEAAAEAARSVPGKYWENLAARLAVPAPAGTAPRRQLAVPFVRQHHMTCAPATLAAVSRFLGAPIDHLELARTISYDGTPDHEERHALEARGWRVREFRVTWEVATALLARGLPFTLVTTWTQSAHLQAVVGCDPRLGTLIIRDPHHRATHEVLATELLEEQAPFGPRGMVFVPEMEAARLDGIDLPEAADYDEWFRLRRALVGHERAMAADAVNRLHARTPAGRLTWWAQRQLAYYDDNPARALAAVTALRELFPKETNLQLEELSLLTRLGRRVEHRARVAAILKAGKADPAIWREQVELWRHDAREHRRARRLAARYARARPHDWQARWTLAHTLWDAGDHAGATRLYRLAACAGDKTEAAWQSYFSAARHGGAGEVALEMLRGRVVRLGAASGQPAATLARALEQIERPTEARKVFESALTRRPEDGELRLGLAIFCGRRGEMAEAEQHLAATQGRAVPAEWRRVAARLAGWRADHAGALGQHDAVLAENPLDVGALGEVSRLRAVMEGEGAALAWLAEQTVKQPYFLPLRQLRLEWLRDRPAAEALAEVEAFLALEPTHAWALRERALILLRAERPDEALASARLAEEIEPGVPQSPGVLGQVLLAKREFAAARVATERALRGEIAADWLMAQLLSTCPEFSDRVAAVAFLRGELVRQPSPTTGFLRFRTVAIGVLSPEELSAALEALRARQGELWEPWSACIQQEIALGRSAMALALAREATEKFPLTPRAWLDLADAHRLAHDDAAEEAALTRAAELSPGWRDAALRLAALHQRKLRMEAAAQVLRMALAHDPLDAGLRGRLAEALWHLGRSEEAMAAAERAAEAAPAWDEPWGLLARWSRDRGTPDHVVGVARRVAGLRSGDAAARRRLALVLGERGENAAALAELKAAVRLWPRDVDAHDLCAFYQTRLGQRDEALAACAPEAFGSQAPQSLQGRAAWVRWQFGERMAAVEAMRAVVAAHPDYVWAWQMLAEWHNALDDTVRAAEAAQKYAELRSDDAAAWGQVAALKLKAREFDGAVPLLERALRLDSSYGFATFQLLRLACEASRWERADEVLAIIRQHQSRAHALRCETMFHRARLDQAATVKTLRALCHVPAHESGDLAEAATEFADAGWNRAAEAALRDELTAPDCNAEAGAIWMRLRLARQTFARPRVWWLERAGVSEAVRRAAWHVYLEWLAEQKSIGVLRWHLWRRKKWLAASDTTWGQVGYVLTQLGWHRRLVGWMADWQARASVEPWMLSNLVHALIVLDRSEERAVVVSAALRLPADHTRSKFVAWAARAAAMAGRHFEAAQLLAGFEDARGNGFALVAAAQARALVDLAGVAVEERKQKFAAVRQNLEAVNAAHADVSRLGYMVRDHRRTLRLAAQRVGSPWRWWYAVPLPSYVTGEGFSGAGALLLAVVLIAMVVSAITAGSPVGFGLVIFFVVQAIRSATKGRS